MKTVASTKKPVVLRVRRGTPIVPAVLWDPVHNHGLPVPPTELLFLSKPHRHRTRPGPTHADGQTLLLPCSGRSFRSSAAHAQTS